jgi:hypothetical protein
MREEFLHFIWLYQLFDHSRLKTEEGEVLLVLQPGVLNTHSGPDFSEARIRIGENIWVGNVEIHIKSTDWYAHNHHLDDAYNNVMLHVVYEDASPNGEKPKPNIPVLNLKGRIDLNKYLEWQKLVNRPDWIPCTSTINTVPEIVKLQAIERMSVERLERKTEQVNQLQNKHYGNWEKTLFIMLARSLGAKVNAEPFQLLAELLSLNEIKKLKDKDLSIEAMLYGTAGLLIEAPQDEYTKALSNEYEFLKHKFKLEEMNPAQWKFMRMRPANFPSLRIAQLAAILNQWEKLSDQLFYHSSAKNLEKVLRQPVHPYWKTHYRFGNTSKEKTDKIGKTMVNNIIINTFVPFLYAYGKAHDNESLREAALETLQQISPEKNNIISKWKALDINPENAFETQGLIELKNQYCAFKKCLTCKIGVWLLNKA